MSRPPLRPPRRPIRRDRRTGDVRRGNASAAHLAGALQSDGTAGPDGQAAGFLQQSFTLANYTGVFAAAAQLGQGFANSFLVALFTTAVAIAVGAPAAYALARLSIPGANTVLLMVLGTQMLPGIVIAIPLFIVISSSRPGGYAVGRWSSSICPSTCRS